MTDSPVAANIMVLQDWPTAWQQVSSRRLRRVRRSSPGSGSVSGLSPDSGIQRIHYCSCPIALGMPRDAGAHRAAHDVVEEKRLRLKEKEEYFCCLGLRERHNSLSGVDGLLKSRKFAMMFRLGRRPESMQGGAGDRDGR